MKTAFFLGFLVVMAAIASNAQQTAATAPPQTAHVTGHGCVKPGNVADCVVVNDYKAHRKYNVFFRDNKPEMNTGISFEGIGYGHVDPHCKQGQKIEVSDWTPLPGECPQAEKQ